MGRWDCLPACRPEGSGAGEFVTFWHWLLAKCAGSRNRSCLCPKLEPLIERPAKGQLAFARMSQNTMTTIYTGLDIAKLNLQLHLAGRIHDLPNTAAGHRRLPKEKENRPPLF
jgi:hypothetical protein